MAINALIGLMGRPVQPVNVAAPRMQNAQATLYEEQAERARQQQAEEQATMQALGQAMGSPGGMSPENVAKIARVNPKAAMAIQGIASKQQADQLAVQKATREAEGAALDVKGKEFDLQTKKIGRLSNRLSSISDPLTFKRAIYGAMADGDLDEQMGQQFLQADYNDPQTQAVIKSMIGEAQTALQKSEEQRKAAAEGRAVAGESRAAALAAPQLDKATADAQIAQQTAAGTTPITPYQKEQLARGAMPNTEAELAIVATDPSGDPKRREAAQQALKYLSQHKQSTHVTVQAPAAAGLTPDAVDMLAGLVANGGQLPALGMGAAGAAQRAAILNKAATLGTGDLATNKAEYAANAGSLKNLQRQNDAVLAFERTAMTNLDTFLNTAKKVIDTKSPLLNQPIRALDAKLFGGESQAAFNTARQVAINEIAKVLTNPGSNAALSDSARHEVASLITPDATLPQIYAAAKILKTDMENRKKSFREQIQETTGRLNKQGTGGPVKPPMQQRADPLGIR